ncbi:hypothetical protein ET495_11285 [Xylanimonas allomyrinae]|uniref:Uncharacterized protein n=1 Tax=Xylanimonas allomyrinae TaxID=2509459 RepID=A0A4P6EPK5_9MICO|nr:hypothetical protein [Xylanimonas allomyrinae]QAY63733.1 hypothetical protein ET495_11285 [Xylanimonas allomyrinae]
MSRDGLLDDALALVRAAGSDREGFAALVNGTDCVEHHGLIVRLCQMVRISARDDLEYLAEYVEAMQERGL